MQSSGDIIVKDRSSMTDINREQRLLAWENNKGICLEAFITVIIFTVDKINDFF